jgi:hypothetical protein
MGALVASTSAAQARGVAAIGIGVPVGDFAEATGGAAEAGGGTALVGLEWLPTGRSFGLRIDGAYNRFCTTVCDESQGELDVRYRLFNLNLNGIFELPLAGTDVLPYALAGAGLYNYKLEGDDVAAAADDGQTDLGLNAGLGLTVALGRVGVFAEGRFHNVFAEGSDLQYIPIMLGARIGFR